MLYILIVIFFLIIILYVVSIYAFKKFTLDKRYTLEECFQYFEKQGLYSKEEFDKLPKEELEIDTFDKLKLRGIFIEKFKESKRVVIIVHGYRVCFSSSLIFMNMFFRQKFNVLLVDQRAHGRSDGIYATYGYYEKKDLDLWVNFLRQKIGEDAVIGLHGQSMGGGTVLEYAEINKYAKFIIADCPYSDGKKLIKHVFNKLSHLPMYPFVLFMNFRLKRKAKFSIEDISPMKAISDKSIPVMFIHGSMDELVPSYMSEEMYKAKKGLKRLLIVEGAKHGNAYETNKELYEKEVEIFLEEVLS
jgi:uncharacterized protein